MGIVVDPEMAVLAGGDADRSHDAIRVTAVTGEAGVALDATASGVIVNERISHVQSSGAQCRVSSPEVNDAGASVGDAS